MLPIVIFLFVFSWNTSIKRPSQISDDLYKSLTLCVYSLFK